MVRKRNNRVRSDLPRPVSRSHWSKPYGRRWKAKHPFLTLELAREYIEAHGLQGEYTAYYCEFCGCYHVGHTDKGKTKNKKQDD